LLASFIVEVDKAGELARGNEAVSALKARLAELQAEFAKVKAPAERAGKAIRDALTPDEHVRNAIGAAAARARNSDAIAHLTGGGGAGGDGFLGAGLGAGKVAQFGPTRDTMNAGRAQMRAAEQAAASYAQTLRGKLASAVAAVRAGFNGGAAGAAGGGPGLIASLATVRNGMLALGAGAVIHGVKRLVDSIGSIGEQASALGVTTDQFQRLDVLAKMNNTSVEALGTAFRTLGNAAVQPTKETAEAFAKLGITTTDASGQFKSANDLFFEVGEALSGVSNEMERGALAQDLLGRSAQQLRPIFAQGTEAFKKQRLELLKLKVLSPETIAGADAVSDSFAVLGTQVLAAAEPLIKTLIPGLLTLTTWLAKGVELLGKLLDKTDLTAIAITALGYAIVWKVIPGLRLMIALSGGSATALLGMGAAAAGAAASFLLLAAKLFIIQDLISFLTGHESAIGSVMDKLFGVGASTGVLETLAKAWDMIASAVKAAGAALGLFNLNDEDKAQGDRASSTWQGSNFQSLAHGFGEGLNMMGGAGAFGAGGMIPGMYMPPAAGGAAPPAVSVGDNNVTINMSSSATASDVASAVRPELERSREALVSSYPP
jgi:hypothetical protein